MAKAREVILVEGILDAVALISCGYANALPLDGTEGLREEHLALLRAEHVAEVYLCLDGDAAGRAAAEKVAAMKTLKSRTLPTIPTSQAHTRRRRPPGRTYGIVSRSHVGTAAGRWSI